MSTFSKIIAFLLVNTLGFFSPLVCSWIGFRTGLLSGESPGFDAQHFQNWFLTGVMVTWLVCAIFSLASFFLHGKARLFFLWAPVIVPMIYGLSVLYAALSPGL